MADWTCEQCGDSHPSTEMTVTRSADGMQLSCTECSDPLADELPECGVKAYAGP